MYFKLIAAVLAVWLAVASAGLVGAPVDADINDEGVQNALQFAVAQFNRQTNDVYVRQVSKVIKVQTQVVSGLKHIFTVMMARTNCRKGGVENHCTVVDSPPPQKCTIEVWSQPWRNFIQVTKNTCK